MRTGELHILRDGGAGSESILFFAAMHLRPLRRSDSRAKQHS